MTSHIEGWPMTLLEAQQYGCIPIVFNTFAALPEIIENNVNGYIIEKYNEKLFSKTIITLMGSIPLREKLFHNCQNNCLRFSPSAVGDKWDFLLKRI